MRTRLTLAAVAMTFSLAGCAAYAPPPPLYTPGNTGSGPPSHCFIDIGRLGAPPPPECPQP